NMTVDELEMYDKAGIAIADARGAVEQSRQEGRQEGRQDEAASLLTRQLQRRFGDLPTWAGQKMADADLSTLEEWSLRILDAPTLEGVLTDPS
ncbi:MAG: DUF4351 domain-containing protein, partial [Magnetococcus sp. DMHC-8]